MFAGLNFGSNTRACVMGSILEGSGGPHRPNFDTSTRARHEVHPVEGNGQTEYCDKYARIGVHPRE